MSTISTNSTLRRPSRVSAGSRARLNLDWSAAHATVDTFPMRDNEDTEDISGHGGHGGHRWTSVDIRSTETRKSGGVTDLRNHRNRDKMDERTYDAARSAALSTDTPCTTQSDHPATALQAVHALEAIIGGPLDADAIAALNNANADLLDLSPTGLMPGLARNLVVMQALSTKLVVDAMSAKNEGARTTLLRTALAASREARETLMLMRELKTEARSEAGRVGGVGAA